MSGFAINWLNLREVADLRARDADLLARAKDWLAGGEPNPVVVDLGAGTGSTLRAFSEAEPIALTWRLVDQDKVLLEEAQRRHGESHSLEAVPLDLTRLDELPLDNARLVSASALFDLVSAPFVDSLVDLLSEQNKKQPLGLYAALTYNGVTNWTPAHPLDKPVLDALNADQLRDKGFGPALGPGASDYMEQQFRNAGFQVFRAQSPWLLGETDSALLTEFIAGIGAALKSKAELDAEALADWVQFRQAHVPDGHCEVGHTDLLILPA